MDNFASALCGIGLGMLLSLFYFGIKTTPNVTITKGREFKIDKNIYSCSKTYELNKSQQ